MFISIDNIAVRVADRTLFEHTSWAIQRDQNWAIIGPTGSGKSTLAKTLCRNLPLSQGQILFHFDTEKQANGTLFPNQGEILTLSSETHQDFMRRYAGYHQARWHSYEGEDVPSVSTLLTSQNKNPDSPLDRPIVKTSPEYREFVMGLFQLNELLDRKLNQLSSGESRKVLLVYLLLQSPQLLILDDPLNGLDLNSRKILSEGIDELLGFVRPKILYITSRLDDLPKGIDHLIVVNDARIIAIGERDTVINTSEVAPVISMLTAKACRHQRSIDLIGRIKRYSNSLEKKIYDKSSTLIHMENVSVKYEGVEVLQNINWTVMPGERWALLGHNGAGKTTLLSLILADNPQSYANEIVLFGNKRGSGESIWEIKQNIGWVSSELQIFYYEQLSCLDIICSGFFDSVGLYHRCTPEQIATAKSWLSALDLGHLASMPFQTLSTGQQRLTLLGRALVKNPPLLILDEPCQALDDFHRKYILELLNQLCTHSQITMIYVTHYREEIPASTTHLLELDHGKIISRGVYQ